MKPIITTLISIILAPAHSGGSSARPGCFSKRSASLLGFLMVVVGLLSPPASQAQRLVTFQFEGVITESSSAAVSGGDRFRGAFTYDLDAVDERPDSTNSGSYFFEMPDARPVGMHYTVGALSHQTEILADLLIFNNSFGEDWFLFGSDALGGPGLTPAHGSLALIDDTMTVFDSDRPPGTLDLARFSSARFEGSDGTLEGQFGGEVDGLRLVPSPTGQPGFLGLGVLAGGLSSRTGAVSGDGSTVVGSSSSTNGQKEAFRWTATSGMKGLGDLPGEPFWSGAAAVSFDGTIVVGSGSIPGPCSFLFCATGRAVRWTDAGGVQRILDESLDVRGSDARGISANGDVVVGMVADSQTGSVLLGYRRSDADELLMLDPPSGDAHIVPAGVSSDGAVIFGDSAPESFNLVRAFRWTSTTGSQRLAGLPGAPEGQSYALAASSDGSVIVGRAFDGERINRAFRWTEQTGMVGLPDLLESEFGSTAIAVSADGSVIIGMAFDAPGGPGTPFIWDAHGMRNLRILLESFPESSLSNWGQIRVSGISADGRVIVGDGLNPSGQEEAWMAVLPPPEPLVLTIARADGNLVLSWPQSAAHAVLEHRAQLASPGWSPVLAEPNLVNGLWTVSLPATGESGFFRLRVPLP